MALESLRKTCYNQGEQCSEGDDLGESNEGYDGAGVYVRAIRL